MMMISMMLAAAAAATSCASLPTQPAMNDCQQAAAARTDAEMNRVWRQTRAVMAQADIDAAKGARLGGGGYAQALLVSQRAWLAFRDAQCTVESYEWKGGSMQGFTENQCRAEVTKGRTRQLAALTSSMKD